MLNPYIVYIRLAAFLILAGILAIFAYKVHSWRSDALELGAVRQEMVELKAAQEAAQKASEGYQSELEEIRNRPVPSTPVRLCKPARVSGAPSGPSATVPPSGVVSGPDGTDPELRDGPDIGPALRSLAKRAEEVSAQARATQGLHLKGPR